MLENLLALPLAAAPLTLPLIIWNILLAFGLSLLVAIVYRNTHRGLSYSQSFTFTLVLIGLLIAVVMMVIGNSLAIAFGAFGAFSLIRFRSAIKDTRDIAFILLVVAIGLAVGTNNYLIAVATALFILPAIYYLSKFNFGSIRKYDYLLNFSARQENFSTDRMRAIFREYLKYDNLLNVASRDGGQVLDYSFNVKFENDGQLNKFIEQLGKLDGIQNIDLIAAKNDIEY